MAGALLTIGILSSPSYADDSPYQPRKGYWNETYVARNTSGDMISFVLSQASYPATCVRSLNWNASQAEGSNGFVWTDTGHHGISFKEVPGFELKLEVTEFKCIFVPWSDSGGTK